MLSRIVFTGGGTAGHVIPNLAIMEILREEGWEVIYFGSNNGIEKNIINSFNIPYHSLSSGKFRRYFSWKNFLDPFKVLFGINQAFWKLRNIKPNIVFSKGGFVSFPVVFAAWLNRIPVIAHESDITPGLATYLSIPFVKKICLTFPVTKHYFRFKHKIKITGNPIRKTLFYGSKIKGLSLCNFKSNMPCLLVIGGGHGSFTLNVIVRKTLDLLCSYYQVIHLCGINKMDFTLMNRTNYCQLEYASDIELSHLLAAGDIILSRSGSNTLYELLILKKPHILVPLSIKVSRGDQIQNAIFFEQQGISKILIEETLTPYKLFLTIQEVYEKRKEIIKKIKNLHIRSATSDIVILIKNEIKKKR